MKKRIGESIKRIKDSANHIAIVEFICALLIVCSFIVLINVYIITDLDKVLIQTHIYMLSLTLVGIVGLVYSYLAYKKEGFTDRVHGLSLIMLLFFLLGIDLFRIQFVRVGRILNLVDLSVTDTSFFRLVLSFCLILNSLLIFRWITITRLGEFGWILWAAALCLSALFMYNVFNSVVVFIHSFI